ncbi:MAG TPA: hypothetical protein VHU90_07145 [Galbitalea sp.]|nr:hypothetical protein [Galbitalea sp.]
MRVGIIGLAPGAGGPAPGARPVRGALGEQRGGGDRRARGASPTWVTSARRSSLGASNVQTSGRQNVHGDRHAPRLPAAASWALGRGALDQAAGARRWRPAAAAVSWGAGPTCAVIAAELEPRVAAPAIAELEGLADLGEQRGGSDRRARGPRRPG